MNKEPHQNCPSFDICSTNKCPLHRNYKKLIDFNEDKLLNGWKKCRAEKPVRIKIGTAFKLRNKGLRERELASLKQWEAMTQEEREAKKQIFWENIPAMNKRRRDMGLL